MSVVFEKTKLLTDKQFHYCPGCNHGIIHRLVAEVIDEMNLDGKVIGVAPVGCSVFAYDYFNCDMYEAAHGRAPAVATGAKRVVGKDTLVFTYQGDGDLASIGTAEIVHAAHRGEKISTIFVNNAIYGMTGGQMAPTTLVGQKTTTSPYGRDEDWCGAPLKVSEMLAEVPCSYYIERVAVNNTPNIVKAKKAISKAFHYQMEGKGFTLVEVLSACPTNWGLSPIKAMEWLEENMIPYYPLGVMVTGDTTILADENMKKLLGVDKDADPEKCYQAWVNNIAEEYLDYVKDARDTMMVTDKTAQIEYKGFSPQHGKVTIRCVGTKTSENEAVVTIDGYYRILEDMLQIRK